MKREIAKKLNDTAHQCAARFSNPSRAMNFDCETFEVYQITPLSESTACVAFKKYKLTAQAGKPKFAVAFFYYLAFGDGRWFYFFPTDSHVIGMSAFGEYLRKTEADNYEQNFDTKEV